MDIQTEHMKQRCLFISAMCFMSIFGWCRYSLFDPINSSFFTPYYQNGLLFLFYLGWDTHYMLTNPTAFRTDLMIHHAMSFVLTSSSININALAMSHYMVLECISLMNYAWRRHPRLLRCYRTLCIVCVRVPLSVWVICHYVPHILVPHWESTLTPHGFLYMKTLFDLCVLFFVFYDVFLLWKIVRQL